MTRGLFDLSGKTVLVTGGNSGIGLGFARGMARQGADAILWGRNEAKNAAAAAEIETLGVKAFAQIVDVSDEAQVIAGFAAAVARVGRIDCVVQNAGFANPAPSFVEMTTEQYHAQIDAALNGGFYTLREAARHMVKRAEAGDPGGAIIICGSGSVFAGIAGLEHYAAAKSGLAAIMRGMATELGRHGIRVNMIAPGYIRTDIGGGPNASIEQMFVSRTPIPRIGHPDDLEGAAAYLASDAARYHTGDILNIDGGWLASYF
jgi:NAD(P)-dependent dehydrogenase (short-subunit alcohol dehydrogenase family)